MTTGNGCCESTDRNMVMLTEFLAKERTETG